MNEILNFLSSIIFYNVFSFFGEKDIVMPLAIAVLLFGYIVLTIRLNFIQFTKFGKCLKFTFSRDKQQDKNSVSPLKTLLTSIASCTGMNATAGVVFMIFVGGIGTVFWLPIMAFICMAFRFAEIYLSHHYRSEIIDNDSIGGPFDYIKKGLAEMNFVKIGKICAILYASMMLIGGVFGLSMFEMNQAVVVLEKGFSVFEGKRILLTIILVSIAFIVVIGGNNRISNFMGIIMPILSISYLIVSIIVIAFNYDNLVNAVSLIIQDAFKPKAIAGGWIASFCMCARKNSLAHETGLGTAGIVHSQSKEKDSIKEATRGMLTPVINSILICMASALVLTTTKTYQNMELMKDGVPAITSAFGSVYWIFSYLVITIIPMFTLNVVIGWSNYCIKCAKYIFNNKYFAYSVLLLFFIFAFVGGVLDDFIFVMNFVDTLLMFVVLLNVPIVIALSGKIKKAIKEYNFNN